MIMGVCPLSVINSLCFSLSIIYYQLSIMKKLGLLLVACFVFATISVAQNNIVKSLERNVPGQGKVTIHQDARIAALIGSEYVPTEIGRAHV